MNPNQKLIEYKELLANCKTPREIELVMAAWEAGFRDGERCYRRSD